MVAPRPSPHGTCGWGCEVVRGGDAAALCAMGVARAAGGWLHLRAHPQPPIIVTPPSLLLIMLHPIMLLLLVCP